MDGGREVGRHRADGTRQSVAVGKTEVNLVMKGDASGVEDEAGLKGGVGPLC